MTSIEREKLEILARKARALREDWLRRRQERLARQLAANAEVRKRWWGSKSNMDEREARLAAR